MCSWALWVWGGSPLITGNPQEVGGRAGRIFRNWPPRPWEASWLSPLELTEPAWARCLRKVAAQPSELEGYSWGGEVSRQGTSSALDPRASLVDASYSLGSSPWEPPATKRPRTQLPMGYCAFQPLSFLLGETGQIHQSFTLRIRVPVADLCLSLTIVCWVWTVQPMLELTVPVALYSVQRGAWAHIPPPPQFPLSSRIPSALGALVAELSFCHRTKSKPRGRRGLWTPGARGMCVPQARALRSEASRTPSEGPHLWFNASSSLSWKS